jgi:predicted Zn-dependent protease
VLVAAVAVPAPAGGASQRLDRLFLVPLGPLGEVDYPALEAHYRDRFGIDVQTLPTVEVTVAQATVERRQVIAEELIALMQATYPDAAADGGAVMIGITELDMYIRDMPQWAFGLSLRADDRFAVISAARMNPANLGDSPDLEVLQTRLRKMVTKNVGVLFFGMAQSPNPHSVLYFNILGIDDLDNMGEDW